MSWYYSKNGTQLGPISEEEIYGKVRSGEIAATNLMWKEGMGDWVPASQLEEFSSLVQPTSESATVTTSAANATTMTQPPAFAATGNHPPVANYLWQSIVATVLCCMPFGVVAIVFAAKVDGLVARGDFAGAQDAAKKAKTWCIWSFVSGLVFLILAAVGAQIAAFQPYLNA